MSFDLRTKILALLCVGVGVMVVSCPLVIGGVGAGLLIVAIVTTTRLGGAARLLRSMSPLLVIIVAFATITTPNYVIANPRLHEALWRLGPLTVTLGGVLMGLTYIARIAVMITASWMAWSTSTTDELIGVMVAMKLPTWMIITVMAGLASIPAINTRRHQIALAQTARGVAPGRGLLGSLRANTPVMVPLIATCLQAADDLAISLATRGFGARKTMTLMTERRMGAHDTAACLATIAVTATLVWARLAWGFGRL